MKKNYKQPIVELTQMMSSSMVMAGSPGDMNLGNGGSTYDSSTPIAGD